MKKVLLLSLVMSATSAFAIQLPSKKSCALREAKATNAVTNAEGRFNVGEITRTDVAEIKMNLFDIQLECADVVRGDAATAGSYCAQAPEEANDFATGSREEATAGQRTSAFAEAAEFRQLDVSAICED